MFKRHYLCMLSCFLSLWPASASAVTSLADVCAPCTDTQQCEGLCITDDGGSSTCLQACATDGTCPANFTCATTAEGQSYCSPNDATVCPSEYVGAKNTFCRVPATDAKPNGGYARKCDQGLTCYTFPTADGSDQDSYGVCVTECSSVDATKACAAEETCCFGTAADRSCQKTATARQSVGGCFIIGDVGASCFRPDHSYCTQGAYCASTQTDSAAVCYARCINQACTTGGYCQEIGNVPVCCNASTLDLNDITTCTPLQGVCRREVGVECEVNEDCRLNLCQKNGTQSACSVACSSDADCPRSGDDVNGDGVADGGGKCLNFGGVRRCWPRKAVASPPACATKQAVAAASSKQGCQCAGNGGSTSLPLLLSLALLVRRIRRRP